MPWSAWSAAGIDIAREEAGIVVVLASAPFPIAGLWVGDFVVEETGQDEGDGRAPCAADIGQDLVEGCYRHGSNVAEDNDDGRKDGEAQLWDGVDAWRR